MTTKKKRQHPNPEVERADGKTPTAATFASDPAAPGFEGTVYVTRGVPPMTVKVLASQHVHAPEDEHGPEGDYYDGDTFKTDGPTAHMLEARGIVEIIEEHA